MYVPLLIYKYLGRKLAPLFAMLAVALCSAMVIIVSSVMGGFEDMMISATRQLSGDVIVERQFSGFAYEELLERIREAEGVEAAAPVVRTYGLLRVGNETKFVQVDGIDPPSFHEVTGYRDTLHWESAHVRAHILSTLRWMFAPALPDAQAGDDVGDRNHVAAHEAPYPGSEPAWSVLLDFWDEDERGRARAALTDLFSRYIEAEPVDRDGLAEKLQRKLHEATAETELRQRRIAHQQLNLILRQINTALEENDYFSERELRDLAMAFTIPSPWEPATGPEAREPAPIVPGIAVTRRSPREGGDRFRYNPDAMGLEMNLTVVPVTRAGGIAATQASQPFVTINEFRTGRVDKDQQVVFVPIEVLQRMVRLDESEVWPEGLDEMGQPVGEPRIEPARATRILIRANPDTDIDHLTRTVEAIVAEYGREPGIMVSTWRQENRMLLEAVENEKMLLTVLFAIVSLVAAAMIGVIFYMIVMEKTRDIGVLRAVGASRVGIVSIFLSYGLALGVIGAAVGLLLAALVVNNLNEIQDFLANVLGIRRIWDPDVYYFDRIPGRLDPTEVTMILFAAIIASVVAAILPGYLASRVDPVQALRYE